MIVLQRNKCIDIAMFQGRREQVDRDSKASASSLSEEDSDTIFEESSESEEESEQQRGMSPVSHEVYLFPGEKWNPWSSRVDSLEMKLMVTKLVFL